MTWIFDATPLIVLAKADHLAVLDYLDGSCLMPTRVYEEVVETGLSEGYPDARRIQRAVDDGQFTVEPAPESTPYGEIASSPSLSRADAAVLALAADRDGIAVMDERAGRAVADAEEIRARGTAFVVLHCAKHEGLSAEMARTVIDDIVDAGWHCSTDLYAKILRKLEAES